MQVESMGKLVEVGEIFRKVPVVQIVRDRMNPNKEIGAIVEFMPGKDGMVHISQIANERIDLVTDKLKVGDMVDVKVMAVDPEKGRISLSIKELLND